MDEHYWKKHLKEFIVTFSLFAYSDYVVAFLEQGFGICCSCSCENSNNYIDKWATAAITVWLKVKNNRNSNKST